MLDLENRQNNVNSDYIEEEKGGPNSEDDEDEDNDYVEDESEEEEKTNRPSFEIPNHFQSIKEYV